MIDASVALKWFLRTASDESAETDTPAALDILKGHVEGRLQLLQPVHFQAEVCAVLARKMPAGMRGVLRDLGDLDLAIRDDELVMWRAMQLSSQLGHHLFDTLYHALALETDDAVLVTADYAYCRKAQSLGRLAPLSAWPLA